MGAALRHAVIGPVQLALEFRGWRLFNFSMIHSNFIARQCKTNCPHIAIEALFDSRQRVINFHHRLHREDAKVHCILHAHPGRRPAGRHIGCTYGGVGFVVALLGLVQQKLHHLAGVAGGGADLQPAFAKIRNGLKRSGYQVRIVREACQLQRNKFLEHALNVFLVGLPAKRSLPALVYFRQL